MKSCAGGCKIGPLKTCKGSRGEKFWEAGGAITVVIPTQRHGSSFTTAPLFMEAPIRNPGTPWRSKRLEKKANIKQGQLDEYFGRDGMFNTVCQVCGGLLERGEADWCHLKHEGMGGGIARTIKSNGIAAHGFRSGPSNCHKWIDYKKTRLAVIIAQGVNLQNGGVTKWDAEHLKSLLEFRTTGHDTMRGV